ncbi:polymorphic toxin-type HINT domain-containing protein [Amycolatopsis sp. TNS106]|uniref:polymorphic toxin-type HINT domain-containing protein n=2 Tax=Amycolatopsis TaxID=1813 RepID=UPI001C5A29A0|nr:polymorphic toxin-type HINT domain-containing protein [Amycolatopsis sp. TNS106]QXV63070.1 type IV secretion protein Rhs [Amycolatopsis sp. TNS106]
MVATTTQALPAAAADPSFVQLPSLQQEKSVPGKPVPARPVPANEVDAAAVKTPAEPKWPGAAAADVELSNGATARSGKPSAGFQRAGALPVSVAAEPPAAEARGAAAAPAKVRVQAYDQALAEKAGITGLVVAVDDAGGAAGKAMSVQVDYRDFANAFGGDYGSRLKLTVLPECAVTTPDKPECRAGQPLQTDNNTKARTLTGKITLPNKGKDQTGTSRMVLAATAAPSGAGGSFEATGLSPAGQWSAGGSSGDFTYSVPLRVPPPTAGIAPKLGLGYSSGTIDGRTSATNNQAAAPGDGWELSAGGFIERRYKACADDLGGSQGQRKTGDLCWATDNAIMHLNGVSAELVKDEKTGVWRPKNDDGSRIERLTGAVNGDDDGEHWKVTSNNGTQYFLGLNRLPGWTEGKPETGSAFTVPVFGNNAGEPCAKAAFSDSWCQQAYRWNLDYVVDPNGNATTYYYDRETNFYGRDQSADKQTSYVAAGFVRRIEYGLRAGALFAPAPSRVWFDTAERCLPTSTFACNPDQLTKDTAKSWPDVPFDRICKSGEKCDGRTSPAFFSRKRLVKVLTQIRRDDVTGPAQWRDVDAWTLRHQFPDTGDGLSPALWLAGITHTGLAGGTAVLPEMVFHGRSMPNRVEANDGLPPITRHRIERVLNEAGGITEVKYSDRECVTGSAMPANPETNTMRCFPSWWLPEFGYEAVLGWFHKYVVTAVTEDDRTGGSELKKTEYQYQGGAAWHFDDAEFTEMKHRTWSQWRGFGEVRTIAGEPGKTQTVTAERFLRGMDGDRLPDGKKRMVEVADSEGGKVTDSEALAGFSLESLSYDGGKIVSASVKEPWLRGPTATAGEDKAFMTNIATVRGRTLLGDGSWRRTKVTNSFDDHGNVIQVEDAGDTGVTGDETCSRTTYVANNDAWILTRPSTVRTVALPCAAGEGTPKDVVAHVRSSYDGQAFEAIPAKGNLTATERWTGTSWQLTQGTTYDALGRPSEVVNAQGHKVTTTYSPGPEFGVRTVTKKDPLGFTSVTTLDPAWALTTTDVGISGERADIDYDPLGRVIRTWAPGRSKVDGRTPSSEFDYEYRTDAPTVVTTRVLREDGKYTTSYTLYDGLLRERQAQLSAVAGGRVLTDWFYDSRGLKHKVNGAYYNEKEPEKALLGVLDNAVPNQTRTVFDALQRETEVAYHKLGVKQWQTSSSYEADRVTVIPPEGGTTTTVIRDVHGRAVEKRQHHGRQATSEYDSTKYVHDVRGLTTSVTGPDGAQWSYEHDQLGRRVADHDPDRGTTRYTYTALDQLETVADSRGAVTRSEYDLLGRKVASYETRAPGQAEVKTATWSYDALKKGLVDSSTRWIDGKAYTKQVGAYDSANRPTMTKVVIPEGEGKLTGTYTFRTSYEPNTGRVATQTQPAAGGLDAEIINHRYNELGLPTETFGIDTYVPEHLYSKYGETLRLTMGSGAKTVYTSMFYEEGTRRLSGVDVQRNLEGGTYLAKRSYAYDPSGNVTKIADTPPGAVGDTQCFAYDYLKRMTSAFTPKSGDCAVQPSLTAMGGAAPYWHEYAYDKAGNRTSDVDHRLDGDVTRTYAYGGQNGTQPHTLRSVTQTGPQGTSKDEFGYDTTGNMTTRNISGSTQKLDWDPLGRTEKVTEADGRTSTYLYDADGGRLIKREPGSTTLYLDGMELVLKPATQELTGRRYYDHGGTAVAVRTSGAGGGLSWLLGDHQGTAAMSVNASTLAVSQRRQDAFGNPRGEEPKTWPDDKGFVGGAKDESGLTNLGARQYDPETGRFISPDPVLDTDDPQQMNGYAYANNAPATNSDPSGLYWKTVKVVKQTAHIGFVWKMFFLGLFFPLLMLVSFVYWVVQTFVYRVWIDSPWSMMLNSGGGGGSQKEQAVKDAGLSQAEYEEAKKAAADKRGWMDIAIQAGGDILQEIVGVKGIVDNCIKNFSLLKCGWEVLTALPWGKILKGGKIVDKIVNAFQDTLAWIRKRDKAQADLRRVQEAEERLSKTTGCNSFVPGTLVVMADGSRRPIEQLKLDDQVLATDAETGKTTARKVVATIIGQGQKRLVEISVAGGAPIVATDGHPFWLPEQRKWVPAKELVSGSRLQTSTGTSVQVAATRVWDAPARVHNLTINADHTYYVLAGGTSVLVHNSNSECPNGRLSDPLPRGMNNKIASAYDDVKAGRLTSHDTYQGREHPWWAGAKEYRVPGRPETDRILEKELPGGGKALGWTSTHYQKIQRFGAPHFPDSGWK